MDTSAPSDPVLPVDQSGYVTQVVIALVVILCLPVVTIAKRWWDRRRAQRESAVRRYEAIESELCSPEELFAEKVLREEYDSALDIAAQFKLNADPVYQKQWLQAEMTVESISDFLLQVRDRHWTLAQCLTRVPESLSATWALLQLGISLTDSDYFPTINALLLDENGAGSRDLKRLRRDDLAAFTTEEQELVFSRCQLFLYKQRLETLERILGGEGIADFHFKGELFKRFRDQSVLQSAVDFARAGRFDALSILFTHHGDETLPHWLLILSNIPEVVSPFLYQKLLPECGISESDVYGWEESAPPCDEDWSEIFAPGEKSSEPFAQQLYLQPEFKELVEFRDKNLTKALLTKWFDHRARQIEQMTSLVDNALQLVKLGIQKNLMGLMSLHQELEIFAAVIYDCFPRVDPMPELVFDEFRLLKAGQVIDLLMIGSERDPSLFVRCIRNFILPYIQKIDKDFRIGSLHLYLEQFLLRTASKDISLLTAVFQSCVVDQDDKEQKEVRIISGEEDLLRLALEVLYQDREHSSDFLDNAFSIVECLPQRSGSSSSPAVDALQDRVDVLEKHVAVCEACAKYSCHILPRRLLQLQTQKKHSEAVLFFQEIVVRGAKSSSSLTEAEWTSLLTDIVQIHRDCFADFVSKEEVHCLFIRCLLTHGRKEFFALAIRLMKSLGVENCTELILEAARDYTNAANSWNDPSIQLANTCLQLLSPDAAERHPAVRAERNFLQALSLIYANFSLPLLPIQVRLIEDPKLALVQQILQHDARAYRKADVLLQICRLIQVCQEKDCDSRDAAVLIVAGESALSRNDYSAAFSICKKLMSLNDSSGWHLCLRLGTNDLFAGRAAKLELLSYALSYCPVDDGGKRMASILKRIYRLEEELRTEEMRQQQQQELSRKVLVEGVNVIAGGAQAITGGAQIFTNEVSKTAHSLTSWLLPTLKTISKDIIDKGLPIRSKVESKIQKEDGLNDPEFHPNLSDSGIDRSGDEIRLPVTSDSSNKLSHQSDVDTSSPKSPHAPIFVSRDNKADVTQRIASAPKPVPMKKKSKLRVVDDPTEDWDDWDSQASSTNTSRASSVKSVDIGLSSGRSESGKKESTKKLLVVEDDNDGNWDEW